MQLSEFYVRNHSLGAEYGISVLFSLVEEGDSNGFLFPDNENCIIIPGYSFMNSRPGNNKMWNYSLHRLFKSDTLTNTMSVEILDRWDGTLFVMDYEELSIDDKLSILDTIFELSHESIREIDAYNDAHTEKAILIQTGEKYSVDGFVQLLKNNLGIDQLDFSEKNIKETLSVGSGYRIVIDLSAIDTEYNKIILESYTTKDHVYWVTVYGDLPHEKITGIPVELFGFKAFLLSQREEDKQRCNRYCIIEHHLNSIEVEAVSFFIANLQRKYSHLFRFSLFDIFNDIYHSKFAKNKSIYSKTLASLPKSFKRDFTSRLLENIPLSDPTNSLDDIINCFGDIIKSQLTIWSVYRHFNIIVCFLSSNLRPAIQADAIRLFDGNVRFYFEKNADYSKTPDIDLESHEEGTSAYTSLNINITKIINYYHGERDILSLFDRNDNTSVWNYYPLKAFGPEYSFDNDTFEIEDYDDDDGKYRSFHVDYPVESIPNGTELLCSTEYENMKSEKSVEAFLRNLTSTLTIEEIHESTIAEKKDSNGFYRTIIQLPNFTHLYRTITLLYKDRRMIEAIMLRGIKLETIAKNHSGIFLGLPSTVIIFNKDYLMNDNLILGII